MTIYQDKKGNSYSMEVLHKRLLGILKYIDRIARKNNIEYYLAYGTLLGAIRHKGFIPGDDDADITISRDNYYRLIEAIKNDNDERYRLYSLENNPQWFTSTARVVDTTTKTALAYSKTLDDFGVFVDIMPLDGQPDTDLGCKFHFALMTFYKVMATCADHKTFVSYERSPGLKKLIRPIASIRGARYWGEKADKLARKLDYNKCKYVCYGTANHKEGEITKESYASTIDWPFEDAMLKVPVGYHEILTGQYGDYMQLPPEEDRVPCHIYDIYDLGQED